MSFAAASLSEAVPHDQMLRRRIPAWLLSLTLHLTAVLVGTLLVRGTQLPATGEESARPAAIVLAQRTESTTTNYFTPEDLHKGESEAAAAATSPLSSSEFSDSLPTAAESPPPSTVVRLPELPGRLAPSGETIVLKPQSSGTKGRSISHLTEADKAAILAEDAARPRVKGPTGPAAKVSLFGSHEAVGHSFVFLIDRSQSMGGDGLGAIEAAAKELATSVAALEETHKFQVIAYNQKPLYLTAREMLPATTGNKQQLIDFVKNLPAFGATEHEVGIYAALKLKPDAIFLLTDGGDPMLNAGQIKNIRAAAKGTAIHSLHFGSGAKGDERSFLETLAEYTGGSYLYIDMADRR
ncbi:MAG: VWA domain-containing protein [Pirellulaceae bacterium]